MYTTSHQPMRGRMIPRHRDGEQGCIQAKLPGRSTAKYRALREQETLR